MVLTTRFFDVERFNLRKTNEFEVRKQYKIKISNRFAALANLSDMEDINRAWENIKEHIETSSKESLIVREFMQRKPWFDEECLHVLDQREREKKWSG